MLKDKVPKNGIFLNKGVKLELEQIISYDKESQDTSMWQLTFCKYTSS